MSLLLKAALVGAGIAAFGGSLAAAGQSVGPLVLVAGLGWVAGVLATWVWALVDRQRRARRPDEPETERAPSMPGWAK